MKEEENLNSQKIFCRRMISNLRPGKKFKIVFQTTEKDISQCLKRS